MSRTVARRDWSGRRRAWSATTFTGKRPVAATATARRAFFPGIGERFLEDLDLHGLAAEEAFELADTLLQFTGLAGRNDVLVGFDGDLATLGHELPPFEQQAWRGTMHTGDGGHRHARLKGRLDQSDLLIGSIAVAALAAGDDFNVGGIIGYRRVTRRKPRGLYTPGRDRLRDSSFSEEKEAKRLYSLGVRRRPPSRLQGEKFFGSFFQERTSVSLSSGCITPSRSSALRHVSGRIGDCSKTIRTTICQHDWCQCRHIADFILMLISTPAHLA